MAVAAVTFDGTRLHTGNATGTSTDPTAADWTDLGGGKAATEPDFIYQGSGAVSEKVGTSEGGVAADFTATTDYSTTHRVWLAKHIATNYGVLNVEGSTGGILEIGSGGIRSAYHRYYVVGSDTYPPRGGWLITPIDPTADLWDASTGTPDLTAIDYYGWACTFSATSKAENVALDAIDYIPHGSGLTIVGGDGVSTDAVFQDFVDEDEGTTANRWGVVYTEGGTLYVNGTLILGTSTATVFTDSNASLVFPDGIFRTGFNGLEFGMGNASNDITLTSCSFTGRGASGGKYDTRPHYYVEGTTGVGVSLAGSSFVNSRRILLNNKVTSTSSFVSGGQVDPANIDYGGYLALDAASSEYVESQESVAVNSTSGDFELSVCAYTADWTPTNDMVFISHGSGTTTGLRFRWELEGGGLSTASTRLFVGDGTATSQLARTMTDDDTPDGWMWVRVTYDAGTGGFSWYHSWNHRDTPVGDVDWVGDGSGSQTARVMASTTDQICIGSETSTVDFFDGRIAYAAMWKDGYSTPDTNYGEQVFEADWRTGAAFSGSPLTRADSIASITWEAGGTSPTYTSGDNASTVAAMSGSAFIDSTSASAILWNVNVDPDGKLDNCSWESSGTGHAIQLGPNCPSTITLDTGVSFTGYAGTDGDTGNEVIYNNSGKSITMNVASSMSIRNGTGASTTLVINPVTTLIHVSDDGGADLSGARVILYAKDNTSDLPFEEAVTSISRSGTLATVTHTAHGMVTGDQVMFDGITDKTGDNYGSFTVTVNSANEYEYTTTDSGSTSYTGTILATGILLEGTTDVNGDISRSRTFGSNQPVTGRIRKSTSSPVFKTFDLDGTVNNATGLTINVRMVPDE